LNSTTAGPRDVIASPAYNSPENGLPRRTISTATGFTISSTICDTTSLGSHGSGA
jgi:hypothetical protein